MHRGYIKVWRKTIDTGMLKNHKLWAFWSWCLLKASHKETTVIVGYQEVKLQAGQFIYGRNNAAIETGLTHQEVRTCLKNLEKMKKLTIKPTNKFSIVSVIKWDIYQQENYEINQQTNQQLTNKEPTTNQQLTTNKNVKNEKKYISPDIQNFVDEFISYINQQKGNLAPKSNNLRNNSLDTVDKLIRIDGFDLDYIKNVCRWALKDEFWSGAFFSLSELRKTSQNGNLKFQNMANAYEKPKHNGKKPEQTEPVVYRQKTSAELDAEIDAMIYGVKKK